MNNQTCNCSSDNCSSDPDQMKIQSKDSSNCDCSGNDHTSECPSCYNSQPCDSFVNHLTEFNKSDHWITGETYTAAGIVPQIATRLSVKDTLGAWKVRWGINRMHYQVNPGLYGVGSPDKDSPVLVSCNYKLSFDTLRKELTGLCAWILVLDTKGINVWCAAGKGTFGTHEIISRLEKTRLAEIVSHKNIILPQLGAPGVKAHEVYQKSGFHVVYGPVQAKNLKAFLTSDMKATDEMRKVPFTTYDRLVLTPLELVGTIKLSLMIFGVLFLLNFLVSHPFDLLDLVAYMGAILVGCVFTPVLLPYIPGPAFAWKGWILGLIYTVSLILFNTLMTDPSLDFLKSLSYFLILPGISSYYAMNFTGSSTYTSFSGVQKEMRIAVPIQIISIASGIVLILIHGFFTF